MDRSLASTILLIVNIILATATTFAAVAAWRSVRVLFMSDRRRRRKEMHKDYGALSKSREIFWTQLLLKYGGFRKSEGEPPERFMNLFRKVGILPDQESLEGRDLQLCLWLEKQFRESKCQLPERLVDLVRKCGVPPNIVRRKGSDLQLWLKENFDKLDTHQSLLCAFVYSVFLTPITLYSDFQLPSDMEERELRDAHLELADFWDTWVPVMSMSYLCERYERDREQLIMLSWLEVPYETGLSGRGKIGLFRLAKNIERMRKLPSRPCRSFRSLVDSAYCSIRELW